MFAVDAGSTAGRRRVMRQARPACEGRAGGRLRPPAERRSTRSTAATSTSRSTSSRTCRASCRCSSSSSTTTAAASSSPAETNTGLKFVTRANVRRYLTTTTRYEGSTETEKYPIS